VEPKAVHFTTRRTQQRQRLFCVSPKLDSHEHMNNSLILLNILSFLLLIGYFLYFSKKSWGDFFRLKRLAHISLFQLLTSFIFGTIFVASIYVICSQFGWYILEEKNLTIQLLQYAMIYPLITAILEEILVRGILLQALIKILRTQKENYFPIILQALVFSCIHQFTTEITYYFIMTFSMAIFLGVIAVRTNSLWMPIGFHFAWNFGQKVMHGVHQSRMPDLKGVAIFEVNHTLYSAISITLLALLTIFLFKKNT
jgi:membrane protease YdiL (CAAX protease family)